MRILKELNELITNEVISKEIASSIEQYYEQKKQDTPNRLLTIFGVLGATFLGLGIILVLAHNWDTLTRMTKTGIAFMPLLISQILVGFVILKKKGVAWKETTAVALFFSVGTSIALISQIYNIPGNTATFLLTWALLTCPLIYLLQSKALMLIHLVLSTYYGIEYGYDSGENTPWAYIGLLAWIIPAYLKELKGQVGSNFSAVISWAIAISVTIVAGAFVGAKANSIILVYVVLFSLLYNIGKLELFTQFSNFRNGFKIAGMLGSVVMLMIATFRGAWDNFFTKEYDYSGQGFYVALTMLGVCIALLIFNGKKEVNKMPDLFPFLGVLYFIVFIVFNQNEIAATGIMNAVVFLLGVSILYNGISIVSFAKMNFGLLIISILMICRFFDTDMSFVLRGVIFMIIGVGFFATNYIVYKKQLKK